MAPVFSFNTKNKGNQYKSGNLLDIDFLLGYRLPVMQKLQVGLAGFYTKQYTDDRLGWHVVADGNRLQKMAIGPQFFYSFSQSSGVAVK